MLEAHLVQPEAVGLGLTVFIGIEALDHSPEWLSRFTEVVSAMPEVMEPATPTICSGRWRTWRLSMPSIVD